MTYGTSSARCTSPWTCLPVCVRTGDELVEHLRVGRRVGGAHDVPDDADLGRRVGDQRRVGEVLHRRWAPLAAAMVERVGAGAVEREVDVGCRRSARPRAGSRPASSTSRGAAASASSTSRGGMRTRPVSASTAAPASASRSCASRPGNVTPTSARIAQRGLVDGVELGRGRRRDARDHTGRPPGPEARRGEVRAPRRAARAARPCTPSAACRPLLRRSGRALPASPSTVVDEGALGAEVLDLGVLDVGVDERRRPVPDRADERLVLEHADVQQAVAHVGERRDAERAAVVGRVAEDGEVALDRPLLAGDAKERVLVREVGAEALDGERRLLESLLHRRVAATRPRRRPCPRRP